MSKVKKAADNRLDDLAQNTAGATMIVSAVKATSKEPFPAQISEGGVSTADRLGRLLAQVNRIVSLPLNELVIEENVRQEVDTSSTEFAELVNSIKETGVMQNLIVDVRVSENGSYKLVCVSGQRRLLAARKAGIEKAFILLKQFETDADRVIAGLAENMLRKGLHAFDIADGYRRLLIAGWTQSHICEYFDRDRKHVQRYLKLAEYPEELKKRVREFPGIFSARVLLNDFAAKSFSTEKLRELVEKRIASAQEKGKGSGSTKAIKDKSNFPEDMVKKLEKKIQLPIRWSGSAEAGTVSIRYRNAEELKTLLAKLEK